MELGKPPKIKGTLVYDETSKYTFEEIVTRMGRSEEVCEECREQDVNPNSVVLAVKSEAHGYCAGILSVAWDDLTKVDLERIEMAVVSSEGYYNYVEKRRDALKETYELLTNNREKGKE